MQLKLSHRPVEKIRKPLASEHFYHDIFTGEFNIYFGYPRTDTCSTCDGLQLKIAARIREFGGGASKSQIIGRVGLSSRSTCMSSIMESSQRKGKLIIID